MSSPPFAPATKGLLSDCLFLFSRQQFSFLNLKMSMLWGSECGNGGSGDRWGSILEVGLVDEGGV